MKNWREFELFDRESRLITASDPEYAVAMREFQRTGGIYGWWFTPEPNQDPEGIAASLERWTAADWDTAATWGPRAEDVDFAGLDEA
jgi:hypothetical protein